MADKIKVFSFFSGAGFLDLGFENAGFDVVYANEISPKFLTGYQFSRRALGLSDPIFGYDEASIRSYFWQKKSAYLKSLMRETRRSADLVGFIGGPPCPDFSYCGLNSGREGVAGKLSSAYVHLIKRQKPDFFVFENVKGLYRTKKHRAFFEQLKGSLHSSGYVTTEHVVNALEYGVPQHRERLIFVGFLRDLLPRSSYEGNYLLDNFVKWNREKKYSMDSILRCKWPETHPFAEKSETRRPRSVIDELMVETWFLRNQVDEHPNSHHHFIPKALNKFHHRQEGDLSGKSFKRLHRWRFAPAACYGNNEVHLHPYEARRISAAEALAIQSMPRKFALPPDMSLTDMFKTIGNGVPFLAARGIAKTVARAIGNT